MGVRTLWNRLKLFVLMEGLCFLIGTSPCMGAQMQADTSGKLVFWSSLRFRYEMQDNFNIKSYGARPIAGKQDDSFLIGRLRLGFSYQPLEDVLVSIGMQQSMVWDLALDKSDFYNTKFDRENNPYEDKWEPFNTYIQLSNILSQPFSVKAGRQLIYYGDNRIFGPGQWGNTGRWIWDAVKASYKSSWGFGDVYYGRTIIHDPDVISITHRHGFESLGFYGHVDIPTGSLQLGLEPFAMTKKDNHERYKGEDGVYGDFDTYYLGARIFFKNFRGVDFDLTYIKQQGDYGSDDVDAYGYHLLLGYHFNHLPFCPFLSAEYSYGSGDSDPRDRKHETFDAAFGARDKMYGRMNLFQWKNIRDAQVNLEATPRKGIHIKAEYHKFWLAEKRDGWYLNPKVYRDETGHSGDEVGSEFDLVLKVNLPEGNEIQAGYSHFWPDRFAKRLASDKQANWVFIQWRIKLTDTSKPLNSTLKALVFGLERGPALL